MKTIIITENQAKLLKEHANVLNEEVTFFSFLSHMKAYIKMLLTNPTNSQPDEFLVVNGLNGEKALSSLVDNNIIIKSEKIDSSGDKDIFVISYKVPRENFERKMKRLYSKLFEENIIDELTLNEDGEGAMSGAGPGASSCNDSAPIIPLFGKPLRRKLPTDESVEMGTAFGDFGYDADALSNKKDPAYDHNNMIKKSFRDGRKGRK